MLYPIANVALDENVTSNYTPIIVPIPGIAFTLDATPLATPDTVKFTSINIIIERASSLFVNQPKALKNSHHH